MLDRVRDALAGRPFLLALTLSAVIVLAILAAYLIRDLLQNAFPQSWDSIWFGAPRYLLLLILPTFVGLVVSFWVLPITRELRVTGVLARAAIVAIVPSLFVAAAQAIDVLISVSAQVSDQTIGGFVPEDFPTLFLGTLISGLGFYFSLLLYVALGSLLVWLWLGGTKDQDDEVEA